MLSAIDSLYHFLVNRGFYDPIHPMFVHAPIGLVIGAFFFSLIGLRFYRQTLPGAARTAAVLALIFWFPTVGAGLMDWQFFVGGGWLFWIKMKMIFAGILLGVLCLAIFMGYRFGAGKGRVFAAYAVCLGAVLVLGFFGGRLAYSGRVIPAPPRFSAGEWVFRSNCCGCHPFGGNRINPQMPLRSSDKTANAKAFLGWIRSPESPMPAFGPDRISDSQAEELRRYIREVSQDCPPTQ